MNHTRGFLWVLLGSALACDSGSSDSGVRLDGGSPDAALASWDAAPEPPSDAAPYLPLKVGNSWTYKVSYTDRADTFMKTQTVMALEKVGGNGPNKDLMAFQMLTTKKSFMKGILVDDKTLSWQALAGDSVVRYREQTFVNNTNNADNEDHWVPHKLRIDWSGPRHVAKAKWTENYIEYRAFTGITQVVAEPKEDTWEVIATNETCIVPRAGAMKCFHFKNSNATLGGTNTKHYWFVQGIGKVKEVGDQVEELVDYAVSWP